MKWSMKYVRLPFRIVLLKEMAIESVRKVANKCKLENIPLFFCFLPSVSTTYIFIFIYYIRKWVQNIKN